LKRSWRVALIVLLVLAAAGLAGALYVTSRPELLAQSLTRLLGRHVAIGSLVLRTGGNVEIELRDLAVHEDLSPDSAVLFATPRALGTQSWPRLLVGQVLPGHWEIESPVVHVRGGGEGALPNIPPVGLRIRQGTLLIERPGSETLRVEGLEIDAERGPLLSGASVGRAAFRVVDGRGSLGEFALEFEGWLDEFSANGSVRDLDLAALPVEGPKRKGTASGSVTFNWAAPVLSTSVDLRVVQFSLELPELLAPIAPRDVRLAAQVVWSEDALVFRPRGLRFDDLEMNGEVRVENGPNGRVRADLRFADFAPGQPAKGRLHPVKLLALRFKTWASLDDHVEAGTIHELRIQTNVARDSFAEAFSFVKPLTPEEFTMTARVSGGRYRPEPAASPFEDVAVDLSWRGNVLDIGSLHMARDGGPLPRIDITIDGMHRLTHLPLEERGVPHGPGVPIPGLAALTESFNAKPDPNAPPEPPEPPPVIQLRDFQVGYPAFLMPIRNARATVRFPPGQIVVEKAQGVVGGAPALFSAVWDREDRAIDVDIVYQDGDAPPRRDPGGLWASGQFDMERLKLGSWPLEHVAGELRARADQVQLPEIRAQLAEGQFIARGALALGRAEAAGVQFDLELVGADAAKTATILGMDDALVTGRVEFKGPLTGSLGPERAFLDQADFDLRVRVEKGTVRDLPTMVALARVTSGDAGGLFGQPLPYDQICADFKLQAGKLRTEDFEIRGSALRALVVGEIDIASEENLTDLVVAVFPLQRVEALVDKIPVVGSIVLGKDGGLIALYVHLEGPWTDRRATLMGPEPTGWFRRLRQLLPLPGGTPTADRRSNGC
jgi:hypothetical protein